MNNNKTHWVEDIRHMHDKYGVHKWVKDNPDKLWDFLEFRLAFLAEELGESWEAFETEDPEEVVDGLIDLCVIAISTLDALGVCPYTAWDAVHEANMSKEAGVNKSRPNPLGLPDMIKKPDWQPPSHKGNHGHIALNETS